MATARRRAKTTSKRKRARKTSPARTKKATRKPKAKRKAKATPRARAKAKPRARKRTARPRAAARRRTRTARKPPAVVALRAEPADDMRASVAAALRSRGYESPDAIVLDVLAAIAAGYARGPAEPPDWLRVDVSGPVADGVVERFATGDRAPEPEVIAHRPQVRFLVSSSLDQIGGADVGDAERDVLTTFSLGTWDPQTGSNAGRHAIGTFVVPWYLAGRG